MYYHLDYDHVCSWLTDLTLKKYPCKYRDMPMLYKHRDFTSTEACTNRKTENQVCMAVVVGRTDFLWLEYAPMFGKTVLIH